MNSNSVNPLCDRLFLYSIFNFDGYLETNLKNLKDDELFWNNYLSSSDTTTSKIINKKNVSYN